MEISSIFQASLGFLLLLFLLHKLFPKLRIISKSVSVGEGDDTQPLPLPLPLPLPPGPRGWPIIGHLHLLGALPHQSLAELAQKHGPLMFLRLGSVRTVVVSNAELAKEFLKTHDQSFASRPRLLSGKILLYGNKDMAWSEYGPYWRNARRLCQLELFTSKRMDASQHIRMEEIRCMVRSIRERGEGGEEGSRKMVDVNSEIFALTRNIISRMLMNKKYSEEDGEKAREFKEVVNELFRLVGAFNVGDFIPSIAWIDAQGYERQMKSMRKRTDCILDAIIEEHQQKHQQISADKQSGSHDFIDVLLSLDDHGDYGHLTMDTIKGLAIDMFAAGTDTSALTIEWGLSEILLNPSVQQKAQQELDRVVGRDRLVEESDIPGLKYLQAIIKETFRLHPAAPFLVPHESTQRVQVCGYQIPAKTRLLVNTWAMGRDPSRWDRAGEFLPERFEGSPIDVRGQDFELLPFGSGRRSCPALSLGLATVQLGLGTLLQTFEWSLPFPSHKLDMSEKFGLTLPKAIPLMAIATPRLPLHLYH